jgi:hypothetical protein
MQEINDFIDVFKAFLNYESRKGLQIKSINEAECEFSDGKNSVILQLNPSVDKENVKRVDEKQFNVSGEMNIAILVEEQCSTEFRDRIMSDLTYFFEHFDGVNLKRNGEENS